MQNLIQELEIIENKHKEFFERSNLKLYQYISISKKPVMIRFNEKMEGTCRLPKEVYEKATKLVMSYYGR